VSATASSSELRPAAKELSFKSVARMSKVHPDSNFALSSNRNMASV
jgi:hypothetical protein